MFHEFHGARFIGIAAFESVHGAEEAVLTQRMTKASNCHVGNVRSHCLYVDRSSISYFNDHH